MSFRPEALDFDNAEALLRQADSIVSAGELDLQSVRRVDSAGISLLLELQRRAQRAGTSLRLRGASPELKNLGAFFGVDSLLKFE